jgi:hypothetical protein
MGAEGDCGIGYLLYIPGGVARIAIFFTGGRNGIFGLPGKCEKDFFIFF